MTVVLCVNARLEHLFLAFENSSVQLNIDRPILLNSGVIGGCKKSAGKTKYHILTFGKESQGEKEQQLFRATVQQKCAYAGHV